MIFCGRWLEMFLNDRMNRKYEVDRRKSILILFRVVIQMQILRADLEHGGLFRIFLPAEIYIAHKIVLFFNYVFLSSTHMYFAHIAATRNHTMA